MADIINTQLQAKGFGSYLEGILPTEVAIAAGAFGASVSQVRNVFNIPIEKFAQAVVSMETTKGLSVNGTDIPTNLTEVNAGLNLVALGSGPRGTYTMSDFFGAMSGLPYPYAEIKQQLDACKTTKLFNIYLENFLAVTWERAVITVTTTVSNVCTQQYIAPDPSAIPPVAGQPRIDDWYYTIRCVLADNGGGYGRGFARAPTTGNGDIVISPNPGGASITTTIGVDDKKAASDGAGTFGRIDTFTFNPGSPVYISTTSVMSPSPGAAPSAPLISVTTKSPPTADLPVQSNGSRSTGGVNTSGITCRSDGTSTVLEKGWPYMNIPVQKYIDQSNTEIQSIRTNNPINTYKLNQLWDRAGNQLSIEQRARNTGLGPLPGPRNPVYDPDGSKYPGGYSPRDFLTNRYPTTQIVFTDSVPDMALDTKPHMAAQTLEGIADMCTVGGQSLVGMMRESRNESRLTQIGIPLDNNISDQITEKENKELLANGKLPDTIPANLSQFRCADGKIMSPSPLGYYNEATNQYIITNPSLASVLDDNGDPQLLPINLGGDTTTTGLQNIDPDPLKVINPNDAGSGIRFGDGNDSGRGSGPSNTANNNNGNVFDTGEPNVPGSFAGNPYGSIIPAELTMPYISPTILPQTFTIDEAIADVIRCNCDCWDNL